MSVIEVLDPATAEPIGSIEDMSAAAGSSAVGRLVLKSAADSVKRVSVELGGKSPNVVYADADLSLAIPGTAAGVFANQGQICSSGSRVYVHEDVYDEVLAGLATYVSSLRLGSGLDPATTMGPVVSRAQQERVSSYLRVGSAEGRVVAQGTLPTDPALANGFFVEPTVLEVGHSAVVAREEISNVPCSHDSSNSVSSPLPGSSNPEVVGWTLSYCRSGP